MVDFLQLYTISFYLILIAIWGILFNHHSIITILIALELGLLGCSWNFIVFSVYLDDITGQVFAIVILSLAGSESALGLAILLAYSRIKGNILLKAATLLKA
jgi:NADH:ubiquinone oxidoreductase subunit K